ncbi:glycosyltransferase family 4 protein [Aridibaculum aurantiacum]|uniref:glycosyltransferase family 4 protein n=1 Tax=Aridibaculum aurantiacum TaxID=2810307 RepID=UPI001A978E31|nr:glycosyltransferase family 4 protein [Aridibaculum aurantiacum]
MKCLVANPNIAAYIKESVLAYHDHDMLRAFYTTFFDHPQNPLTRTLGGVFPQLKREFGRRSIAELPIEFIRSKPLRELMRVVSARKLNPVLTDKVWEWSELSFDRWVARNLPADIDLVHVYEHAGLAILERAKQLAITSLYEQPSQHHQMFTDIVNEQIRLYPELASEATTLLFDDNANRRNERRDQELQLADYVICNSSFTKRSLVSAGVSAEKIVTVPYGFPQVDTTVDFSKPVEKLIFMNAGTQNLRKGIHILYQAWQEANIPGTEAELWMIGSNSLPNSVKAGLPESIKFFPNIPRVELMDKYKQAHVFILPTLADGFGMVISEAMSRGVPVITTYNSGGPDIIEHEKEGLLINHNDKEAIIQSLKWCVSNKHKLLEMGKAAYDKAASYSWLDFRKRLIAEVKHKTAVPA